MAEESYDEITHFPDYVSDHGSDELDEGEAGTGVVGKHGTSRDTINDLDENEGSHRPLVVQDYLDEAEGDQAQPVPTCDWYFSSEEVEEHEDHGLCSLTPLYIGL